MSAKADKGVKMTFKLKSSKANFGIGHIVNLLNGAEVLSTILQICYAVAIHNHFSGLCGVDIEV